MFLETKAQKLECLPLTTRRGVTQSGRLPRASSRLRVLHFMKGPWFHTQLEWHPDLKERKGLPAGYCSDICGKSASSSEFGTVHEWLHTVKVSLLDDHCPVKYKVCLVAHWLLGKVSGNAVSSLTPCGAEGTEPTVRFLSGRHHPKSSSVALSITEVLSPPTP